MFSLLNNTYHYFSSCLCFITIFPASAHNLVLKLSLHIFHFCYCSISPLKCHFLCQLSFAAEKTKQNKTKHTHTHTHTLFSVVKQLFFLPIWVQKRWGQLTSTWPAGLGSVVRLGSDLLYVFIWGQQFPRENSFHSDGWSIRKEAQPHKFFSNICVCHIC